MLRRPVALLLVVALLSLLAVPAPARADMKKTGTVLAVVGLGLVGAGVVLYLTRGEEEYTGPPELNTHQKESGTTAFIVGGSGVALMAIGVSMRKKAGKKEQGVGLRLEPRPGAVALAYRF
jgi:hypothetical protein